MANIVSAIFLSLFIISCNPDNATTDANCDSTAQAEGTAKSDCSVDGDGSGTANGGSTNGGTSTGGPSSGTTTGSSGGGLTSVPTEAFTWDANIYYTNFSSSQEAKVVKAIDLMKKVISSKTFKDRVINFTYGGKKTYVDNGGYSNAQIYQIILDGAEKMGVTNKNNTMDVELELYYASTSTIGYTYPNVTRIWMNTKYFNSYTANQVAGNLMHEWLHKLGFGHASSYSVSRDSSVPYAIGYMMLELSKNY